MVTPTYRDGRSGALPTASELRLVAAGRAHYQTRQRYVLRHRPVDCKSIHAAAATRIKAVVTTTIRLRLDRRSTPSRLQFDRATTIRRPTLYDRRPVVGCCTAA